MSRNLCCAECPHCGGIPTHEEESRPITQADAGVYFPEYEGMLVANARCRCGAKYLAWVDDRERKGETSPRYCDWQPHFDLSYRSTFNDKPGIDDTCDVVDYDELREALETAWGKAVEEDGPCPLCGSRETLCDYPCVARRLGFA